VKEKWFMPVT
jgi:flagellar biosynthesis/type III secretory pathway protein FliH